MTRAAVQHLISPFHTLAIFRWMRRPHSRGIQKKVVPEHCRPRTLLNGGISRMANSHLPDSAFRRLICCGCVGVAVLGCPRLIWGVDYSRDLIRQQQDQTRAPGFEESPKSKEELDPETRRKYEIVRRQYAEAEQALKDAIQQAFIDDPLRQKALDLSRQASEKEQELKPLKNRVDAYFEQLPADVRRKHRAFYIAWGNIRNCEIFDELLQDAQLRPFILYFCRVYVQEIIQDPSSLQSDGDFAYLKKLMPDPGKPATDAQCVKVYLKILTHERDKTISKYHQLKNVKLPQFVRDFSDAQIRSQFMFLTTDAYFRMKTPESISKAEKEMVAIGRELFKIWPRWRWAEVPPELRDLPERFMPPVPQRHTTLWWMIGGNLVFFIALFLFLRLRAIKPIG
jgi:hypothetical protein